MNKAELVERIAAKTDSSKRSAERFLNAFLTEVEDALANGDDVEIRDFGNWDVVTKKSKQFFDINKKEVVSYPPIRAVKFSPGKQLRDRIQSSEFTEDSELTHGEV